MHYSPSERVVQAISSLYLLFERMDNEILLTEKVDGVQYDMNYTVHNFSGVAVLFINDIEGNAWFKEDDIDRIIELASEYDHIKLSDGRKLYEKYNSCRGFAGEPCTMYFLEVDGQCVTIDQVRELLTEKDLNSLETTMREVSEENDNNAMSYIM